EPLRRGRIPLHRPRHHRALGRGRLVAEERHQRREQGGGMSSVTRAAIWDRLSKASLVEGTMPEAGEAASPWFIPVRIGFAGWLGALFLLGFVGAAFAFVFKSASAALFMGACACAAAIAIFRAAPKSDFMAQFGLAVSFAGQALILFGMADMFRSFNPTQF